MSSSVSDRAEVTIIGGGPAGLAAAATLAGAGVPCVLVDERDGLGGQIHRPVPDALTADGGASGVGPAHRHARIEAVGDEVDVRLRTTVWGLFTEDSADRGHRDRTGHEADDAVVVATSGPDGARRMSARHVLVASGAHDRPVAFEGWTLPGVMTAGAVQTLVKSQGLVPGDRVALVGTHPFLLLAASQLVGARVPPVCIVFEQNPLYARHLTHARRSVRHGRRLLELWDPVRRLRRHGVPVRFGRILRRVEGDAEVRTLIVSPVRAGPGHAGERIACDTVGIGYGFAPSSELARQAGCRHRYSPTDAGFVVDHDAWMRTSHARIFAAGEPTGIGGAVMSELEGHLAGLGILLARGDLDEATAIRQSRPLRRRLRSARRLADLVKEASAPILPARITAADDATIVCRCEDVTLGQVRRFLSHPWGGATPNGVKLATRAGMGYCQGRYCESAVLACVAVATGRGLGADGCFTTRAPVKPVALQELADDADR